MSNSSFFSFPQPAGASPRAFPRLFLPALALLAALVSHPAWGNQPLQLGGLVSLDHVSGLDMTRNPRLEIGEVALEASAGVSAGLQASVRILAERDLQKVAFDQAMGSWTPENSAWSLLFGQQTFNHGFLSTRLISDPEILDLVEINRPGVSAAWSRNTLSLGLALAVLESHAPDASGEISRDHAFIPNLDVQAGAFSLRLSALASRHVSDMDLAAAFAWDRLRLDAEGFHRLPVWDAADRAGGYCLGGEFRLWRTLALAFRHDGTASGNFARLEALRHAAGLSFVFQHDLFAACEYAWRDARDGSGGHMVALQVGMKSSLELPGFQRKTLIRD